MKCIEPGCKAATQVIDSRENANGVRRRRECEKGHRFTTTEMPVKANALFRDLSDLVMRHYGKKRP